MVSVYPRRNGERLQSFGPAPDTQQVRLYQSTKRLSNFFRQKSAKKLATAGGRVPPDTKGRWVASNDGSGAGKIQSPATRIGSSDAGPRARRHTRGQDGSVRFVPFSPSLVRLERNDFCSPAGWSAFFGVSHAGSRHPEWWKSWTPARARWIVNSSAGTMNRGLQRGHDESWTPARARWIVDSSAGTMNRGLQRGHDESWTPARARWIVNSSAGTMNRELQRGYDEYKADEKRKRRRATALQNCSNPLLGVRVDAEQTWDQTNWPWQAQIEHPRSGLFCAKYPPGRSGRASWPSLRPRNSPPSAAPIATARVPIAAELPAPRSPAALFVPFRIGRPPLRVQNRPPVYPNPRCRFMHACRKLSVMRSLPSRAAKAQTPSLDQTVCLVNDSRYRRTRYRVMSPPPINSPTRVRVRSTRWRPGRTIPKASGENSSNGTGPGTISTTSNSRSVSSLCSGPIVFQYRPLASRQNNLTIVSWGWSNHVVPIAMKRWTFPIDRKLV